MNFDSINLRPGDQLLRRDVHTAVGGQTQSGISPSSTHPIVMLFSNPASGEQYGYYDGPKPDGYFHYSGEGQRGDQEMKRGNKRIRDHKQDGRELHLFLGDGKGRPVTYAGQYAYVDHYETDAPALGEEDERKVIMFRLRNLDGADLALPGSPHALPTATVVDDVLTEQHMTERFFINPSHEVTESERREAALVKDFERHELAAGKRLTRKRITVSGELKPLFCDLFDDTANELVEAKGTVTRSAVRTAIGQLYDYRRFIDPEPSLAILLPEAPRPDLGDLLRSCGIRIIHRTAEGFARV